jgi:predicted MFS family arabinose efflux permease
MQDIVATFKCLAKIRMIKLAPLWIWTAISNTTTSGIFVALMTFTIDETPGDKDWDQNHKTKMCLMAMIGLGVGEISGALFFGQIQDRFTNKTTTVACMIATTVSLGLCFTFTYLY